MECWGAQGGGSLGAKGGYAIGNVSLSKSQTLYVFVGQQGTSGYNESNAWPNGGAKTADFIYGNTSYYCNGGGASTHIATVNKLIKDITPGNKSLLIVAGGGGGYCDSWGIYGPAGSGGGISGGDAPNNFGNVTATGGTQTSAGLGGGNQDGHSRSGTWLAGAYGQGGGLHTWSTSSENISGGGGGGYYGGGASWGGSGAGGSGYIGGVTGGYMQNGIRSGNGYARITYIGPA